MVTCALQVSAQVINYEIDESFNSGLLFNRGAVSDVLSTQIDTYMIMGMFFPNTASPLTAGAMISNAGSLYNSLSIGGLKVIAYKNEYLQFGQGIRRFNIPGGTNQVFRFEFQKSAYSGPLSNVAYDAMVMEDDHILVAGRFFTDSTLMGTAESHLGLRQLCMIDSTGAPVPEFPMIRCAEPVNAYISSVRELSTGEYIVSGTFNEIEGHYSPKIAKLNADFSVNTDFPQIFGNSGQAVFVNLIDSDDRIWVIFGPNMTILGEPDYASRMLRLMPDGSIDEGFDAPICIAAPAGTYEAPVEPRVIAAGAIEDEDNTFIIHGDFYEVNGEHRRRLAKITDEGALIEGAFESLGADSAVWGNWTGPSGPVMGAGIRVVKKLPDGKLLLGGQFSSFGGEPYSCLVRLQPAGFVGTDDREGRGALKVYPNPARNHFRIELPEGMEALQTAELCDMQGRVVQSWPAGQGEFAIDGLPAGMYVVRAAARNMVFTEKLVVE